MSQPQGLFLVTDTGQRIPVDTKLHHIADGCHHWQVVIEGDLNAIMPNVVAFDGPALGAGNAIHFDDPGPGWDTEEWGRRVLANSQHVFPGGYHYGNEWIDV